MPEDVPEDLLVSDHSKSVVERRSAPPEWLDAHRWLVFALLALIPFLVTLPVWIFGLSADPIWSFSGIVQHVQPGPIAGSSFGRDPNTGWTSQALGHLAASEWLHGNVPWWNSYSGIGLPLAGEMQPGAFFLPFIFLLLLGNGFLWLRIAMQLIAGFSTFFLLREMRLGRLAALLGGLLFEFSGTFAWSRGPDSFFCAAAFLPLLLLGIEQVCKRDRERTGTLWIALGIAFSVLAGFPEAAYIDGLLALLWCLGRFATLRYRWRFALRVCYGAILGLLLSGPLLAGFWSLINRSAALRTHSLGTAMLHAEALPLLFLPYIYSPHPETLGSVVILRGWSDLGGYAGLLLFFLALIGLQSRRPRWLRFLLIGWVLVAWAKSFGIEPVMSLMNHIPFLAQTAFYRYAPPSWEFCLIVLAVFGVEELRHRNLRFGLAGFFTALALALSVAIDWPWSSVLGWHGAQVAPAAKFLAASLAWVVAGLLCIGFALLRLRGEKRRFMIAAVVAIDAVALFTVVLCKSPHPGSVDLRAMSFLRNHLGLSRFYTVDPIQPNYGAFFRTASINYNGFPVPANYARFVDKQIFPPLSLSSDSIFWPAFPAYGSDPGVHYLWKFLPQYQALGVKYVVTDFGAPEELNPESVIPTGGSGNYPMAVPPGKQVRLAVSVPANPEGTSGRVLSIAFFIATYGHAANGDLDVQFCSGGKCTEGARSLSDASDNSFFYVSFANPLPVKSGAMGKITVTHKSGSNPFAFWVWPALPNRDQKLTGPDGKIIPGKAVRVAFGYEVAPGTRYNVAAGGLSRVYHDSLIDVFEIPHPAPYYSVASGGPCRLDALKRDSVHTACAAPAVLIRRELYMPGWHASLSGNRLEAKPYKEIFQAYDLPRGDSRLQFAYVPPHAVPAAWASLFAALALIAEFAFAWRRGSAAHWQAAAT
ncbi:MAG: YfhO family protein [Bryobacteraceae bacterium]